MDDIKEDQVMMKPLEHAFAPAFELVKDWVAVLAFSAILLAPMAMEAQTAVTSVPI